jgi:hypothetical protein
MRQEQAKQSQGMERDQISITLLWATSTVSKTILLTSSAAAEEGLAADLTDLSR